MHKILTLLLALAVLCGGNVYFSSNAMAASEEAAEDEEGAGGDKFTFIELDPLVLPIVDNKGVSQTVSMVVALEVKNGSAARKVEKYMPRLIDAFIQDMYGVLNEHAALKGGVIQLSIIKERLHKISNKILSSDEKEDIVHAVLLQVVSQRRI